MQRHAGSRVFVLGGQEMKLHLVGPAQFIRGLVETQRISDCNLTRISAGLTAIGCEDVHVEQVWEGGRLRGQVISYSFPVKALETEADRVLAVADLRMAVMRIIDEEAPHTCIKERHLIRIK